MELLLYTAMDGLTSLIQRSYPDIDMLLPSRIDQAQRLVTGDQKPAAVYVDDTRGVATSELWAFIQAAHAAHVRVMVNMCGVGKPLLSDAQLLGLASSSECHPAAVAAWLGQQLGVTLQPTVRRVPIVVIGAAKGGVGKTFVTCMLAEGLRRRGLNVLVWDSDISNPGLVTSLRIPNSSPSYLHLIQRGPTQWTPVGMTPFIYHPEHTRSGNQTWGVIDVLVGSHTIARAENDVRLSDWQGLYQGVMNLAAYDIVLVDTPPDYLRRPYATHALLSGATVLLPCPPAMRDRVGVGHLLDHFREVAAHQLDHCLLLFVEAEKGALVRARDVRGFFRQRYPEVGDLGIIPREVRLVGLADEHETYTTMYDLRPTSSFVQAAHRTVDALIHHLGLTPRLPLPKITWWHRIIGSYQREPERVVGTTLKSAKSI